MKNYRNLNIVRALRTALLLISLITMGEACCVIGQWTSVKQPEGTHVDFILSSGLSLFISTETKTGDYAFYRSTDNGQTWSRSISGQSFSSLVKVGNYLFAGSRSQLAGMGGVFRSADDGKTWIPVNKGLMSKDIWAMTVNGTSIFAGAFSDNGGVFKSDDQGASWKTVGDLTVESMVAVDGNIYVACEGNGAFISKDNGKNWKAFDTGLEKTDGFVMVVGNFGSSVFAATLGDGTFMLKGQSWTSVTSTSGIRSFAASGANFFASGNGGGPLLSMNSGASWSLFTGGLPNGSQTWIVAAQGTNLYANPDGKLYRLSGSDTVNVAPSGGTYGTVAKRVLPVPKLTVKRVSEIGLIKTPANVKTNEIKISVSVMNTAEFNASLFTAQTGLSKAPCAVGSPYPILITFYAADRRKLGCMDLTSPHAMLNMPLTVSKDKIPTGIIAVITDRVTGSVVRSVEVSPSR